MMNPKKLLDDIECCASSSSPPSSPSLSADDRSAASSTTTSSVSGDSSDGVHLHHHHSPQSSSSHSHSVAAAVELNYRTPTAPRYHRGGISSSSRRDHHHPHDHHLSSPSLCHTPPGSAAVSSVSIGSAATTASSSSPLSTYSQRSNRSNLSTSSSSQYHQHPNHHKTKALFFVLGLCAAGVIVQTLNNMDGLRSKAAGMKTSRYDNYDSSISSSSRLLPVDNTQQQDSTAESQHPLGMLYVPSLDYRLKGVSQYSSDADFEAHIYCKEGFAKDLKWEWWKADKSTRNLEDVAGDAGWSSFRVGLDGDHDNRQLSSSTTASTSELLSKKKSPSRRLMIGVYAGHDDYGRLLERAVWSARLYAQKWGRKVTVVTLQGTAFAPHGCKAPRSHSTLNKIRLLFHALDHKHDYDQALLLDADTFVFDLDTDITTLLDEEQHVVAGQHVRNSNIATDDHRPRNDPWMIHPGATLWNLNHPLTTTIAIDWFEGAKSAVVRGEFEGDGPYMQSSLRTFVKRERSDDNDSPLVLNFQHNEFDFSHGKVVKQFVREDFERIGGLRADLDSMKNMTIEELNTQRLHKMDDASKRVCVRHSKECSSVPVPQYATS
mmetsp:Transcript_57402/g.140098  ORF Transcript_57402/g.140098 Transcript_57402/m.140098 type:complete len:604 (-) Transcript_57402:1548-3359(-)|eukprot:CAMPEP_0113487968 /NCGR_PEP_ID=MMETSP0014_2-20120614/25775_1 /TAXON_ID=2857 /ORGANISM="Nitzschia sp." /LENGTH=603 /DNA_ID=CAMNT_0000381667 /DNA_START=468 /DNA_END=2279 /DNA_ORIENTATION=+ /assembly_acc=CAM_ASM_000159